MYFFYRAQRSALWYTPKYMLLAYTRYLNWRVLNHRRKEDGRNTAQEA